jgi:hypothetical protein
MRKKKEKKELVVTVSFVDHEGNKVADTPEEFFSKMTQLRRNIHKAAYLEIMTGRRHTPDKV